MTGRLGVARTPADPSAITGWRCRVCGTEVPISSPEPWRCPRSTPADRRHVLHPVVDPRRAWHGGTPGASHANPFVAYDRELAWAGFAAAHGLDASWRRDLVVRVDAAIERVAGVGFRRTPFARSDGVSDALGFSASGGVWVKDETGNVAGSHKARHLMSILLHLLTAEHLGLVAGRPRLAIASCGNAALAAATLARAVDWPIDVFVPTWMGEEFGGELDRLGAAVHRSDRRPDDPPGDPAIHRFRDAVADGAVPFTVQGPENAVCLDGGRTLGFEVADAWETSGLAGRSARVFVQVGGGAFAGTTGAALARAGVPAALVPVQAVGCAPLVRAWERLSGGPDPAGRWEELMTPWEHPDSIADGILDDETYDWLAVLDAMPGDVAPVTASEEDLRDANVLAGRAGFRASHTGSAGLAGVVSARGILADDDRVVVVMSGVDRRSRGNHQAATG